MSPPVSKPNLNIVWIDCEMTGLNCHPPVGDSSTPDRIIEIAAIVTNGDLEPLDEGIEYIIKTDKDVLDNMNEWCVAQHGKTGLTAACLASTTTMAEADEHVAAYVLKHIPNGMGLLAGSSVHADKMFIHKDMPKLAATLHYRILDVSTIKEIARRWYPSLTLPRKEESSHRALSDIHDSIAELRGYREHVFVPREEQK